MSFELKMARMWIGREWGEVQGLDAIFLNEALLFWLILTSWVLGNVQAGKKGRKNGGGTAGREEGGNKEGRVDLLYILILFFHYFPAYFHMSQLYQISY